MKSILQIFGIGNIRAVYVLSATIWVIGSTQSGFAQGPAWWAERGVLTTGAVADDYAAVNQGQLKNIAEKAYEEVQSKLSGGAGATLTAIWEVPRVSTDDYTAINIGQLKNVAKPFYDRLQAEGLVTGYPWGAGGDDFALANIGQVKFLFSFVLKSTYATTDTDGDGLWDAWELAYWENLTSVGNDSGDVDGDELSNKAEMLTGSDPLSPASVVAPEVLSLVVYSP